MVASYLLAPGLFADRITAATRAAGAAVVSAPLGAAPEVADVLLDRYTGGAGAAGPEGQPGSLTRRGSPHAGHRRASEGPRGRCPGTAGFPQVTCG